MRNLIASILIVFVVVSCGSASDCKYDDSQDKCSSDLKQVPQTELKGSIMGAFEVEVDGSKYDDIESFYSEEIKALPAKLIASGYVDYSFKLDAEIGFKDLTNGMVVFIAPKSGRGYAGKAYLNGNDTFNIDLPAGSKDEVYQIRAVKRISLVLTSNADQSVKNLCYNFSAVESEISFDETDKPVVINSFETKITDYDCDTTSKTDGVEIPVKS